MKLRLSIFSFETLAERPRVSRTVAIAIILLAGLEIGVRVGITRGLIEPDYSLHRLTEEYLDRLDRERPEIWLVGNSVVGRGIDAGIISRGGAGKAVALAHGSASPAGSEAMMHFYLDRAPHPREVVFLFSKDDFNRNGQRAGFSRRYLEWAESGPPFDIDRWLALSAARGAIVNRAQLGLARLLLPFSDPAHKSRAAWYDGKPIRLDHAAFLDTARDYEMDLDVVRRLATFRRRSGIAVRVILMPVTDRYVEFHDALFPSLPYQAIRTRLATSCRAHDIPFFDHGDPTDQYHLFSDPYHLNDVGKQEVSEFLAREIFGAPDQRAGM